MFTECQLISPAVCTAPSHWMALLTNKHCHHYILFTQWDVDALKCHVEPPSRYTPMMLLSANHYFWFTSTYDTPMSTGQVMWAFLLSSSHCLTCLCPSLTCTSLLGSIAQWLECWSMTSKLSLVWAMTGSWQVTSWGKPSAVCHPTWATQPFIFVGLINEY